MQKILILLSVSLFLYSCSKKSNACGYKTDNLVAPSSEQLVIKNYLDSNGITAILDTSGFYYQVVNPGQITIPGLCSSVGVSYTGQLMNGKVFDQEVNVLYTLGSLIEGWKKGLPLIKNGGEIKLYIPPSLGYGSVAVTTSSASIPANSVLIFDITLLSVQ